MTANTTQATVPVVDLHGRPLSPCSPEKAAQNLQDGLAIMDQGTLRLNYRPLAYRRIYREIRKRDGLLCAWCGGPGSTLDHVIPICWGGQTRPDNCAMSCRACNHARNNALPSTFIRWTGFRPTHPVIRYILEHEQEVLRAAEQSLAERPLATCVSREEAQVWVAFHNDAIERTRPTPPEQPQSRYKADGRVFHEVFVP